MACVTIEGTIYDFDPAFMSMCIGDGMDEIEVLIDSLGGDALAGLSIYDRLRMEAARGRKITTKVVGVAASAASIVALAGDVRLISENSRVMIHCPWAFAEGSADELRKSADLVESIEIQLADLYAAATGMEREAALQAMKAETWMTASEAVAAGFATDIIRTLPGKTADEMPAEPVAAKAAVTSANASAIRAIMAKYTAPTVVAVTPDVDPAPEIVTSSPSIPNSTHIMSFMQKIRNLFGSAIQAADYTTSEGVDITIKTEGDNPPAVGDAVVMTESGDPAPDGVHTLPDGQKVEVKDGKVASITPAESEDEGNSLEIELEAMREKCAALESELAAMKEGGATANALNGGTKPQGKHLPVNARSTQRLVEPKPKTRAEMQRETEKSFEEFNRAQAKRKRG